MRIWCQLTWTSLLLIRKSQGSCSSSPCSKETSMSQYSYGTEIKGHAFFSFDHRNGYQQELTPRPSRGPEFPIIKHSLPRRLRLRQGECLHLVQWTEIIPVGCYCLLQGSKLKLPGHTHYSCISDIQGIETKHWTLCFPIFRSFTKFTVLDGLRMPLGHLSTV